MTVIRIGHEIAKAPAGNTLVEHPKSIDATTWRRVTVAILRSGQSQPYADSVCVAEIALEGGCRSAKQGFDIPHATGLNEQRVREIARVCVEAFSDNPGPFDPRLSDIRQLVKTETYSVWQVTITQPYCD